MNAILPPLVIDVRVREPEKRGFRIWFPFVILWPLLFLVVGFLLLITVLVDLALLLAGAEYHHYTLLVLSTLRLLALVRGTHARVHSSDSTLVWLDIY